MINDQNAPFSQRSHESCVFLKRNIQNEQMIFLKLNILLKVTKLFQITETWENLIKDCKTL